VVTRTYLSIGDVLSLLREEFPDVTISKIRFLESQGLVNPERSPSGYRKFYETDVERLRWVLRQQRENFLPLKVIRDRLAEDGEEVGEPSDLILEEEVSIDLGTASMRSNGSEILGGPPEEPEPHEEQSEELVGSLHATITSIDAGRTESRDLPTRSAPVEPVPEPLASASAETPARQTPTRATRTPGLAPREVAAPHASRAVSKESAPSGRNGASGRSSNPPKHAAPVPAPEVPDIVVDDSFAVAPDLTGASMTLEELCGAAGLSANDVATIEGFGLLQPMVIAGALYYDEEALTVSRLVAEFGRYGIEPRHLRLYHNFVERELGLVEQIITPLLRQRNPESRQKATETSAELAALGQKLRASLLRRELRRQLGN
jgi:DNA-binding transcriptional MerR regulator